MGLDIRAYSGLRKNERLTDRLNKKKMHLDYEGDEFIMYPQLSYIEDAFPNRANPLKYNGDAYDYEGRISFSISSYGTYNQFRSTLEAFADKVESKLFDDLIDFSDCEGVIGCVLCEKLYNAFAMYEDEYERYISRLFNNEVVDDMLMCIYRKFKHAFGIGRYGGAVEFC